MDIQSSLLSGLIAGSYLFSVTDTNGCVLSAPVELLAPEPLTAALDAPLFPGGTHISCFGANDGSIMASVSGGTLNHLLNWSGPNGFVSDQLQLSALVPGLSALGAGGAPA